MIKTKLSLVPQAQVKAMVPLTRMNLQIKTLMKIKMHVETKKNPPQKKRLHL